MTSLADPKVTSQFFYYKDLIEKKIAESIFSFGNKTKLRDACEYALRGGGKRFRPLLVFLIAEGIGHQLDVSEAALSVEFFHTASLIADDLPCMDNEEERRNRPSLHKVYGESIALLASYALICAAFEKIHNNVKVMQEGPSPFASSADMICTLALGEASRCAGIKGATGGQFFDLFPPTLGLEMVKQIIYQKTITLFEISFVFGWLFGGGDFVHLSRIKRAAFHFGMAFQIADDLNDLAQDEKKQRSINIVRQLGKERARLIFEDEMQHFQRCLKEVNLLTSPFRKIEEILMKFMYGDLESMPQKNR